jgi:hypothetical protein
MGLKQDAELMIEHATIISSSKTANWNSGVATGGLAGADLITIGSVGQWYRLNQFSIVSSGFSALATVTVRAYMNIAGANRLILTDDWTMPEEVIFLSWWFDTEFYGPMRVEIYSNQAIDDGLSVLYEYRIKDW